MKVYHPRNSTLFTVSVLLIKVDNENDAQIHLCTSRPKEFRQHDLYLFGSMETILFHYAHAIYIKWVRRTAERCGVSQPEWKPWDKTKPWGTGGGEIRDTCLGEHVWNRSICNKKKSNFQKRKSFERGAIQVTSTNLPTLVYLEISWTKPQKKS